MSCGDYFCLKCGANFHTRRELDVHLRTHRKQSEDEKALVGGVIKYCEITGSRVLIELENGFFIDYEPSDGGYSWWETGVLNDKR